MLQACTLQILMNSKFLHQLNACNQKFNNIGQILHNIMFVLVHAMISFKHLSFTFAMQVVLSRMSWRWLLAFTALPCLVLLLFFVIAPESPRYLCVQNRMSDATLVLERMAKTNKMALPPGVLTYHKETQLVDHGTLTSQNANLPVRESGSTMENAMSSKSGGVAALRKLFSRKLLRSTLLIWFVWFANSFAYYGLVLLTSQLSDANRRCASGQKSEVHQKNSNLYKDVFITSLAGIYHT